MSRSIRPGASSAPTPRADGVPAPTLAVFGVMFVTGWAANHFAAMLQVLQQTEGFPTSVVYGAFGVYAVGLIPGLLGGGSLSDRLGRRPLVLGGAVVAALGNVLLVSWHPEAGIYLGRLLVGLGAGLVISAGTAWAGDLAGKTGTTAAGAILTSGFAVGPLVSGLTAQFLPLPAAYVVPFVLTIALSVVATLLVATRGPREVRHADPDPAAGEATSPSVSRRRGTGLALLAALPMALWVFSTVTTSIVVLTGRLNAHYSGPWVVGFAAAISLGAGVVIQMIARRQAWGARAGVVGAVLASLGFAVAAAVEPTPSFGAFCACAVVLGTAYGLCLRDGLVDVDALAPPEHRGAVLGVFYVCTYLGFGLPVLLEVIRPATGDVAPLLVLAALAAVTAALRAVHLRTTDHLSR